MPKLCSGERMYVWCMYVHVCVCVCVCVCVQISSLKPLGQLKAGYVYNDYTSCTPGCVTDMVNELGWESLEDRCQISDFATCIKLTMVWLILTRLPS